MSNSISIPHIVVLGAKETPCNDYKIKQKTNCACQPRSQGLSSFWVREMKDLGNDVAVPALKDLANEVAVPACVCLVTL